MAQILEEWVNAFWIEEHYFQQNHSATSKKLSLLFISDHVTIGANTTYKLVKVDSNFTNIDPQ